MSFPWKKAVPGKEAQHNEKEIHRTVFVGIEGSEPCYSAHRPAGHSGDNKSFLSFIYKYKTDIPEQYTYLSHGTGNALRHAYSRDRYFHYIHSCIRGNEYRSASEIQCDT